MSSSKDRWADGVSAALADIRTLRKYGIAAKVYINAVSSSQKMGDEQLHRHVAQLAELVTERLYTRNSSLSSKASRQSRTEAAIIEPKIAAILALQMLGNCARCYVPPPAELVDLVKCLFQVKDVWKLGRPPKRATARYRALIAWTKNPAASTSAVARASGVTKGTVANWRKDKNFQEDLTLLLETDRSRPARRKVV